MCQGRPSALRLVDISAPHPALDCVGADYQSLAAWVELSTILDEMTRILNGPLDSLGDESVLLTLSCISEKLLSWLMQLPPKLQWKETTLPAPGVCALHMQALAAVLLLHRPFAAYKRDSAGDSDFLKIKGRLPGYSGELSAKICTQNAKRISRLLLAFRERHGVQKIFSVAAYIALTAAMSLISELSSDWPQESREETKECLNICVHALRDLGPSFPVAGRHYQVLASILKCCGYQETENEMADEATSFRADRPQTERLAQTSRSRDPATYFPPGTTNELHVPNELPADCFSWTDPQFNCFPWVAGDDSGHIGDQTSLQDLVQAEKFGLLDFPLGDMQASLGIVH